MPPSIIQPPPNHHALFSGVHPSGNNSTPSETLKITWTVSCYIKQELMFLRESLARILQTVHPSTAGLAFYSTGQSQAYKEGTGDHNDLRKCD